MRFTKWIGIFCLGSMALLGGTSVSAEIHAGVTFTNGNATIEANVNMGWRFLVGNTPLQVGHLGVWDEGNDGLIDIHEVAIFLSSAPTIPLVSAFVGPTSQPVGDPSNGFFRYTPLPTEFTLLANTEYNIFTRTTANDEWAFPSGAFPWGYEALDFHDGITFVGGGFNTAGSLTGSQVTDTARLYGAPNFLVPEPTASVLLAASASLLLRRKR